MKKSLAIIFILLTSAIISLIGAEVLLRFLGRNPLYYAAMDRDEPTIYEYDSILGWRNKEGNYKVPPYHPDGRETRVTLLKDGLRITYGNQNNTRRDLDKIILVGGSYTQGQCLSDDETFPWKIQQSFPSMEVLNYGTAGYGTYQSLLTIERILPVTHRPKIVIYGFIDHHEVRNIAPSFWMECLARHSKRGHVFVPYVTLRENGELLRHPPEGYSPSWPLTHKLVTVALAEEKFKRLKTGKRLAQKREATEKLILEMQRLCSKYGASFIVAMLSLREQTKADYVEFFKANNIMAVDCVYPITKEMRVPGDRHPNEKLNSKLAECIVSFINDHSLTGR